MKKSLLLLASLVVSIASFAQWTKPEPSQIQKMATDGTAQFLYNKEAGGFFAGANDWGTRASVATVADSIKFISVDGTFYNFACYPASKNAWLYVSCNGYDAMWVDAGNNVGNSSYPGTDKWQISENKNGSYKISNTEYGGTFGVAEIYRGLSGNTRCYMSDPEDYYEVDGESMPSISGQFYNEWYFIDSVEYKALKPQVELYLAAMNLKGKIDAVVAEDDAYNLANINKVFNNTSSTIEELDAAGKIADAVVSFHKALVDAKKTYPSLDFSAPVAVYNNIASTAEELAAAEAQIAEIINGYLATQASFDSPVDYTATIGDGSDVGPWTREFTGTGDVGTWHTNTWSTEANGGADGTDMTTPFCEDWVGSGSILSDQKVYQVLKNAAPGLYKFSVNVRLYNEKGDVDALTGCKMYFGDQSVTLDEQVDMYKSGSKCVLWNPNKFTIIAILRETADIEFGFDIKDATFNWMAFKETSLLYYGNDDVDNNAALLVKQSYTFNKYEGTDAKQDLIDAYNAAAEAYDAATEPEEISAAAAAATAAKAALDANIAAYKQLIDAIKQWEKEIAEKQDLVGDEWSAFADFFMGEAGDGYPEVTPVEIMEDGDRTMTTEEVLAYIDTVEALFKDAVSKSIVEGGDFTQAITNPGFTDANGKGWTVNVQPTNFAWTGGIATAAVCESWHSYFDISQEVEAPDGIYSVSLNGFCRLDDGVDTEVPAEIYLNDFSSPLMNILDGKLPKDQAVDGFNCYLSNGADGKWTTNPLFQNEDGTAVGHKSPADNVDSSDEEGYWPNGMEGASVAFSAGRYKATAYGLVEGGKMTIGVRNTKSTHVWALWGNFKLTYEGKSVEALSNVLPIYVQSLTDYAEKNEDNLTDPTKAEVEKAISAAQDALGAADGDEMYEALEKVNAALVLAKANVEAMAKYNTLLENINANYDAASAAGKAEFDAIAEEIGNWAALNNDELAALIEKMEAVDAALRIPAYENASDETPVTFTQMIINPDFEQNAATSQPTGWTVVKGEGAEGNYQVQTGYDGGVSMEFWSPSNGSKTIFDFYQKLTGLPAGTYEITCEASNSLNDVEAGPGEGRAYIYAAGVTGEEVRTVLSDPIAIQTEGCRDARNTYSVIINLKEGEDLLIGAKSIGELSARWVMVDNYTLTYYGASSSKPESPADNTAIDVVESTSAAPVVIYSVSGARVANVQKGLNIIKMSDGSVKKVLVK
ncbi:MAG: hypothetical protein MJZ36_06745 [Bacteroidaceae bacterium]|nr:hypothetical protein [Bacteroidaceae bacterium]